MFKDDFNLRLDVLLTRIGRARKRARFWGVWGWGGRVQVYKY